MRCCCFASLFILWHTTLSTVEAWWDEGHLLIAGIARLQLEDEACTSLEAPLKEWEHQYPGLSSLVTASVWPDHIKCRYVSSYCNGLSQVDALEMFNDWHYVSNIYNPQHIELDGILGHLPLPGTGAVWALQGVLEGIPGLLTADKYYPSVNGNSSLSSNLSESTTFRRPLSLFSWNFRLRLLLHIFGDIHQPLHSIETFSHQFTSGDVGGNLVHVNVSGSSLIPEPLSLTNLHALWDSCGGQFAASWPAITEDQILSKAKELTSKYPRAHFGSRLDTIMFRDVALDSFRVAQESIYGEMDWESKHPYGELPVRPSEKDIQGVQSVCLEQIVLGGYRLAIILQDLSKMLPPTAPKKRATTLASSFSLAVRQWSLLVLGLTAAVAWWKWGAISNR